MEKALVAGLRFSETLPEASVPVRVTLRDEGMVTETSRGEAEAGDTEIATARVRRPRKLALKTLKNARCSVRSFADTLYLACVVSLYIICWFEGCWVCMILGMLTSLMLLFYQHRRAEYNQHRRLFRPDVIETIRTRRQSDHLPVLNNICDRVGFSKVLLALSGKLRQVGTFTCISIISRSPPLLQH